MSFCLAKERKRRNDGEASGVQWLSGLGLVPAAVPAARIDDLMLDLRPMCFAVRVMSQTLHRLEVPIEIGPSKGNQRTPGQRAFSINKLHLRVIGSCVWSGHRETSKHVNPLRRGLGVSWIKALPTPGWKILSPSRQTCFLFTHQEPWEFCKKGCPGM